MPRLTTKDYLRTHDRLRKLWLQDPSIFAELTPTEQWQLHDFFRPDKEWSDLQLLQHRDAITGERPSLPHQAGRTLSRFWDTTTQAAMTRVARAKQLASQQRLKQKDRQLVVRPVGQPELDPEKLARAFIWLAHDKAKRLGTNSDT